MAHGSDTQDSSLDSLMSGEWCQQAKQYPLNDPRWTGELNHVSELPGEDRKLQEVWHPPVVHFSILRKPECVADHGLKSGSWPHLHSDERFLRSGVPPVVRSSWRRN